uniref:Src like adaptor n=1 Tax=Naja naja TaxID=35670 RepID=A0A8C6YG55_NAJNA
MPIDYIFHSLTTSDRQPVGKSRCVQIRIFPETPFSDFLSLLCTLLSKIIFSFFPLYKPDLFLFRFSCSWLFEGIGREKAEELLLLPNNKMGSFMIRKSESTNGFYSLSVRHVNVKHYRIFRLPNNWYYISPRQTFQCLEDLVNHYSEVSDGLCCVLTTPCLTQHTATHEVRTQEPPVVMRNKTFKWNHRQRSRACDSDIVDMLGLEDSGLSYGLRNSIASYLALTVDDNSSVTRKKAKKTQSMICRSNHQSQPNFLYYED